MSFRVRSILEHMLEDAFDAMDFAGRVGNVDAFSSPDLAQILQKQLNAN